MGQAWRGLLAQHSERLLVVGCLLFLGATAFLLNSMLWVNCDCPATVAWGYVLLVASVIPIATSLFDSVRWVSAVIAVVLLASSLIVNAIIYSDAATF